MALLREQDFDKLATRVVDQFLSGKAKLADAAAQTAMDAGMNPDQIDRLTQAANTQTFLRMMDQQKAEGSGNLTQEFDPIDPRQVIKIIIDSTGVHVDPGTGGGAGPEEPMPGGDELPDEMSQMHGAGGMSPPSEGFPPHAEPDGDEPHREPDGDEDDEDDAEKGDKKSKKPKDKKKEGALRTLRLRKLAATLEDQYKQAEWVFQETSEQLTSRFKRVYTDKTFASFEKDALAEHGDEIGVSVLNALRSERGLEPLDMQTSFEKSASMADRHITDDSPELHLFERLVKVAVEADKLQRGIEIVRAQCA